jgi:hypothetical protein
MKEYIGKIFECKYCGKKSAWKTVIVNHEKICKENPNNKHKCFDFCEHLIKDVNYDDSGIKETTFYCPKIDKSLYSYKVERCQHMFRHVISKKTRMPLECNFYELSKDYEY